MRYVTLSLLVPLLASGCGSSPVGPSPVAAPAPRALAVRILITPDALAGQGFHSPTAIKLSVTSITPASTIDRATFRMIDDRGEILTEGVVSVEGPVPTDAYLDATTVAQTLTWPAERGSGKRLDYALTLRSASGELTTFNSSILAR